ncbi:MAG: hypothetical protein OQL09_05210 [Gammaproteobacteria bacterium]|nr:hypothetical protein [Gammaproteobacteria bacterium]
MQIEGPFTIRVVDNADNQSRELQLSFTQEYKAQEIEARIESFRQYIVNLQKSIEQESDPAAQQGMLMILQISEQLLPHIETDEIPLNEMIAVEMGPASPFDHLLNKAQIK